MRESIWTRLSNIYCPLKNSSSICWNVSFQPFFHFTPQLGTNPYVFQRTLEMIKKGVIYTKLLFRLSLLSENITILGNLKLHNNNQPNNLDLSWIQRLNYWYLQVKLFYFKKFFSAWNFRIIWVIVPSQSSWALIDIKSVKNLKWRFV